MQKENGERWIVLLRLVSWECSILYGQTKCSKNFPNKTLCDTIYNTTKYTDQIFDEIASSWKPSRLMIIGFMETYQMWLRHFCSIFIDLSLVIL